MKSSKQSLLKITTVVSLACLSIPLSIYVLWIHVFYLGSAQAERVAIFQSYFPDFLQARWDATYISIAFAVLAIILSSISLKLTGKRWKVLNSIILVFSSLLLFLHLFSML